MVKGGITMDWVRMINQAIQYMEEHLAEDITLADISGSVNLISVETLSL